MEMLEEKKAEEMESEGSRAESPIGDTEGKAPGVSDKVLYYLVLVRTCTFICFCT